MYDLVGKVALVTGAASKRGFGHSIAIRLAREGADVIVTGRAASPHRNKELKDGWRGLEAVTEEIEAIGRRTMAIECDITKSKEVDKMMRDAVHTLGHIDILVNNAGIHTFSTFDKMSDEIWNENILVNLTGTFFCSRAAAREMMKRGKGGKIINIASVNGKAGTVSGSSAYSASKFGTIGLTQCIALELAPYAINVNAVCPTLADTDMAWENFEMEAKREGITAQEAMEKLYKKKITAIPLGRLVTGEDIANMVVFLVSKEADYITGQSINVDGGFLMAH